MSVTGIQKRTSIGEIKAAITQLPISDVIQLVEWLANYQMRLWDRQIEKDLESGRLDELLAEIDRECEAGLLQPL